MSRLGELIQAHVDASVYPPSDRLLARRMGVAPTVLGAWRRGSMTRLPAVENLRSAARVLGVPYRVVLAAALEDTGYVEEGGGGHEDKSSSITTAHAEQVLLPEPSEPAPELRGSDDG